MHITSFGGIVPRLSDHMLGINQATVAHNCRLRDGRLEAWREPCRFADAIGQSIYLYGCCPLSWEGTPSIAELTPDWGRFYITGRDGHPYLEAGIVSSKCGVSYTRVGVPAPVSPPRAAGSGECGEDTDARAYVYTYVTQWGEESAPSPPSNAILVKDGNSVTVSGLARPPEGYGVTQINIYRLATGFRPADGKVQQPLSDYQYVATVSASTGSFSDSIKATGLGYVLETQYDRPPPEMAGVVTIGDQVRLAGFNGNQIYFSEQFQPHNWPAKYDLTLDFNIVHMLAQDQRLFVSTGSIPYIIDVSSCDDTRCVPVTSLEIPLPDIGCHSAHGAIMTHHGMFYASPFGIVLLQSNAEWYIMTAKWFGETEWLKLRPDTIRMAYWQGFLFFATDMAAFLLNINGQPYGDMVGGELVTLSDKPVDMITTNTGKLLFLQDNAMYVWDGGTELRPYVWESKEITAQSAEGASAIPSAGVSHMARNGASKPFPVRDYNWWPTSVKLRGTARVTLRDSHEHPVFDRLITTERWHRVRRAGRHLWYRLRLSGTQPVDAVSISTSNITLNQGT